MAGLAQEMEQWCLQLSPAAIVQINAALGLRSTGCHDSDSVQIAHWLLGNYVPEHFLFVSHTDQKGQFIERWQRRSAFIEASGHQGACADASNCTDLSTHSLFTKLQQDSEVQDKWLLPMAYFYRKLDQGTGGPLKASSEQPNSLQNSQKLTDGPVSIQDAPRGIGTAWGRGGSPISSPSTQSEPANSLGTAKRSMTMDGWRSSLPTSKDAPMSSTTPSYEVQEQQRGSPRNPTPGLTTAPAIDGASTLSMSSSSTQTEIDCYNDDLSESSCASSLQSETIRRLSNEVRRLHDELRELRDCVESLRSSRRSRRGNRTKKQRQQSKQGPKVAFGTRPKKLREEKKTFGGSKNRSAPASRGSRRSHQEDSANASDSNQDTVSNQEPGSNPWTTVLSRRRRRAARHSSSATESAGTRDHSIHQSPRKSRRTPKRPGKSQQFSPATKECWTCRSTKHLRRHCPKWDGSSRRGAIDDHQSNQPRRGRDSRRPGHMSQQHPVQHKARQASPQPPLENRTTVMSDPPSANATRSLAWDFDELARNLAKAMRAHFEFSQPLAT